MNRTAVVTGAARGIGAAIASRFIADGFRVLLVDREKTVEATAQGLGPDAVALIADVTSEDGVAEILRQSCVDAGRPLYCLVNNAGITRDSLLARMEVSQFNQVIDVNLKAAYELSRALAEEMREGAIVNVSSKSANGNVGQFNYAVSKAGLLGLTRAMALDLAPRVRVNAVAPAFIATEMTDAIPEELRNRFLTKIPFGRAGEPSEVADLVSWLVADRSSYVTGQTVAICGGRSFAP